MFLGFQSLVWASNPNLPFPTLLRAGCFLTPNFRSHALLIGRRLLGPLHTHTHARDQTVSSRRDHCILIRATSHIRPRPDCRPVPSRRDHCILRATSHQSPTLGAHAHAHPYPWVLGGHGCDIIVHGWASVLCIPASNSKSESNFSDAGNTLTKKRSGLKPTTMNDLLFVRSNQDLV